jgi:glutathione-specific gamma-glutamylcyclotransferase
MIDRPPGNLWVFAYASLMWRPDFDYVESAQTIIHGYHRALCMYSIEFRGTRERPGLVFGLDKGGSCRGIAFRIAETHADHVLAGLWAREMITQVYQPRWLDTHLPDGRRIRVLAFVADPSHEQYVGRLDDDATVALVLQGRGKMGHCLEYLRNTLDHLEEMEIHDHKLHRIVQQAEHEQTLRGTHS